MATHSSVLAWIIPWTEEAGGLQSMGSQGVGHDWVTNFHFYSSITKNWKQCKRPPITEGINEVWIMIWSYDGVLYRNKNQKNIRYLWQRGNSEIQIIREFGIEMYTLLCLKWISSKHLLYSTGNSTQYCVIA